MIAYSPDQGTLRPQWCTVNLSRLRFGSGGNAVFALLVVGVIGELGAFVWLSHHNHSVATPVEAATAGPAVTAAAPPTTTLSTATSALPVSPATTTPALSGPVTARGSVTYTVAPGTEVVVSATGPCWFEVRRQKGSPVLDLLTLAPGASKTYTAPVWMRFGNADNVSVTVGGTRLKLPPSPGDLIVSTG